jgi:hypothetical protein
MGAGIKDSDRRKYRRIPTDQVISFAPVDTRDLLGVSRNLSAGGIRFEAVGCEIEEFIEIDPSAIGVLEEIMQDSEVG